ncbi:MAG: hypothetical protein V1865_00365 [bacterium]
MKKQIEVYIDDKGQVHFDFHNCSGNHCETESERLEAMLAVIGFQSSTIYQEFKTDNREEEINGTAGRITD